MAEELSFFPPVTLTEEEASPFLLPSTRQGEGAVRGEAVRNSIASQAVMAESEMEGEELSTQELLQMFEERAEQLGDNFGYKMVRDQVAIKKAHGDTQGLHDLLEESINLLDIEGARNVAQNLPMAEEIVNEEAAHPMAFEQAMAEFAKPGISRAEKNAIGRQYMYNTLNVIMDKQEWWEPVTNRLGFFLNDVNIDVSRWANSGFWDARDAASQMIIEFKKLPIEQQVAVWPELVESILEATDDNEIKTVAHLLKFLEPGGSQEVISEGNWDIGFWGVDIATIGTMPLIRTAIKASKSLSAIRAAKRMGDVDKAAKLNASILMDDTGTIGKALNTPGDVAHSNALPMSAHAVDDTQFASNISGPVLKALHDLEAIVTTKLGTGDMLHVGLLTPKEQADVMRKVTSKWRSVSETAGQKIQSAKIGDPTPTGFDFLVDFGTKKEGDLFTTKKGAQNRAAKLKKEGWLPKGTEVSIVEKDGGFVVRAKESVNFKLSDVGTFEGKPVKGAVTSFLSSPAYHILPFLGRDSKLLRGANLAELGGAQMVDIFNKALREIVKPLGITALPFSKGRQSLAKIDQVLLQGDAAQVQIGNAVFRGKVYTPAELKQGIVIPTKKGTDVVKLTDKEIEVYYGMRRIFDMLYQLKNEGKRRALLIRGMKRVKPQGWSDHTMGRPFEKFPNAAASINQQRPARIFDPRAGEGKGEVVATDLDFIKNAYDEGYQLVRFDDPKKFGDVHVRNALIHKDDIQELPQFVLHYKDGYVPKVYKNGYYFVKEAIRGNLEGKAGVVLRNHTLRIFDTRADATAFAKREQEIRQILQDSINVNNPNAAQEARAKLSDLGFSGDEINDLTEKASKGEISFPKDPDDIRVWTDREVGVQKLDEEAVGASGGLFDSPRATHDILFGTGGEVAKRYTAFESLQRNIGHISNYFPRNEWRVGMQQRWLNTAHAMGAVDPRISNYRKATKSILLQKGTKEEAAVRNAAQWIDDQARIPTQSEQWFGNVMQSMAEWAERKPGGKVISKPLMSFASKDPFAIGRAAAFHALLGWFNPAQLFVQAQGASIALSMHPEFAMKGLRGSFGLTSVAFVDASTEAGKTWIKRAGKSLGYDPEEFLKMKQLLDDSGLVQSIKQTADHSAAAQGYGMTRDAIKRVADKGLMFYRRGELFTRTYGLSTALERWMAKTGKKVTQITKDEFQDVLEEAIGLNLNMFRANRAAWQRGALSLPTQFLQIQAKWIESLIGVGALGPMTVGQKAKLATVQALLYGSAGIPLGNYMVNGALRWLDVDGASLSEPTKTALNGGAWDLFFHQVMGARNEFASRGAIANDIFNNMLDMLTDEAPLTGMLGAFGEIPSRSMQALSYLSPLVFNAQKVTWTPRELAVVASELGKVTATWRNATKAYYMFRTQTIRDRKGNILVRKPEGFNTGTLIGQALGFRATDSKAVSQLRRINAHNDEIVSDLTETLINHYHEYLGGLVSEIPNEAAAENFKIMTDYYLSMADPILRKRVLDNVRKKIAVGKDEKTRQIQKWLRMHSEHYVDNLLTEGGLGTNVLLTAPPDEQGKK